jgi:hypothetical protein
MTKEAALLLFNSVPVTVSTICRISIVCAQAAGTDEAGHAFQFEAGRVFRSEAGHPWRQSHGSI